MKHQYIAESFSKRNLQRIVDFFVDSYASLLIRRDQTESNSEPKKVLLVTLAHLGDALIASYLFPLIRERYPEVQIDVFTGEWCNPVLQNNPYVNNLIFFNHFRMNRSEISLWEKIHTHLKTSRSALKSIRSNQYDFSIEGRISHPNGNLITYRGKVKRRIGFGSGAFGSLLTNEVQFPSAANFHVMEALLEELKNLGINKTIEDVEPYFKVSDESIWHNNVISKFTMEPFIIVQVESGKDNFQQRMINRNFWVEIVRLILQNTNCNIIICGLTNRSEELYEFIKMKFSVCQDRVINAVKKLSLDEFFVLSQQARFAITVDSFAAHFCAISCKTISFYKNSLGALYFPLSNKTSIVIHNHKPSENFKCMTKTQNQFVHEIESEESYNIFFHALKNMIHF